MEARQRNRMRRLVQVTLDQIASGTLASDRAARALYAAGVPFNVIGRITASQATSTGSQESQRSVPTVSARRAA